MRCEAARRETRPFPSSNGSDLDDPREGDGGHLIGREIARAGHFEPLRERGEAALDELGRRGRDAIPLPSTAAQAHRSRDRLVPRPDPREAERRIGRHGGASAAEREDLRRALARDARGAHLVPGRSDSREFEAAEQLRVLHDRGKPRVVRSKAPLLEQRSEAPLLHGHARLQADSLAHAAADSKGSRGVRCGFLSDSRFKT